MSFNAPAPPNPNQVAAAQQQLNTQSAIEQQQVNDVNQTTPYGSLTYQQTGVGANGIPIEQANTVLNPAEQNLFNTAVQTQQNVGNAANSLIGSLGPSLTTAPNLGNDALVQKMMGWQTGAMQPWFNIQDSNLNSQLQNQGITQGSQAWNNAEMGNTQGQSNAVEGALASDIPIAYNQALESYQAPIQTLGTLMGESQPGNVGSSLTSTPQAQIQPANLESLVQQDYQSQLQNYGNTMSGLFSIPSALLGGWARSGFATPSDRRLKRDIRGVGTLHDGTPLYRFRYIDQDGWHIGVIAQDILETHPEAVGKSPNGFYYVDYDKLTEDHRDGI